MSLKNLPTIAFVRQCLREEQGRLFWLVRPREHFVSEKAWKIWNTRHAGTESGSIKPFSAMLRCVVSVNGIKIFRYRLVWALHYDEWRLNLDHVQGDSLDDRIEQLRPSSQSQNAANARIRSNNTSGIKGVFWEPKRKKWQAQIKVNYKAQFLGRFDDKAEAEAAYMNAARKYFGEFASDGKPKELSTEDRPGP
jgi:hypothetical protein